MTTRRVGIVKVIVFNMEHHGGDSECVRDSDSESQVPARAKHINQEKRCNDMKC